MGARCPPKKVSYVGGCAETVKPKKNGAKHRPVTCFFRWSKRFEKSPMQVAKPRSTRTRENPKKNKREPRKHMHIQKNRFDHRNRRQGTAGRAQIKTKRGKCKKVQKREKQRKKARLPAPQSHMDRAICSFVNDSLRPLHGALAGACACGAVYASPSFFSLRVFSPKAKKILLGHS